MRTPLLLLLLSGLLVDSHPPHTTAFASPPPPPQDRSAAPVKQPETQSPPEKKADFVLRGDDAKIIVFPACGKYIDASGREHYCPVEAIYEIQPALSEGRLQIFNDGEITEEVPLPDVSPGLHQVDLGQGYYWSSNNETLPEGAISCNLGTVSTTFDGRALWNMRPDPSVYDYKPRPPRRKFKDPPADLAASFRSGDLGFSEARIPGRQNLAGRERGDLPEIQLLGVGFVEGTKVNCGKGLNLDEAESPLHGVRVVSTVEHDGDKEIPVLKAGRFTVPRAMFEYPNHIRIVGKPK